MDKVIQKKKWTLKRILGLSGVGGVLALLGYLVLLGTSPSAFQVDLDKVTISHVVTDTFQDDIPIVGTIEPEQTIFLDAIEGGRVEEILVEEGSLVEKDQPLLRLSNSHVSLDFMNRETQTIEQINNLRNIRINMEQTTRQLQEQILDIDYQLREMERKYTLDTSLYKAEVIAKNDFEASRNQYYYLKDKRKLLVEGYRRDSLYRIQQLQRVDASIDLMERNLIAIQDNLKNLILKAPVSGQLTSFNAEIGETKSQGENVGRIDITTSYKVVSQVDEHFLGRVSPGQLATFLIDQQNYTVEVVKVLPEVTGGQFEVHLNFIDAAPESVRRGQTLQMKLAVSQTREANLLPRGAFYNASGGRWVYVVNENNEAHRRTVRLGHQNTRFIEVLEGLEPGERVITSAYEGFGEAEKLKLTP